MRGRGSLCVAAWPVIPAPELDFSLKEPGGGNGMKEKIDFYSSLLFSLLFCLLFFDSILLITGSMHRVPGSHSQILVIGFLLWFISLVLHRDPDDDWAGTA